MYSLFGRHILFSLFMPITFESTNTYVSINNTNAYKVFSDSNKYAHLAAISVIYIYDNLSILCLKDISPGVTFICIYVCVCVYIHTYIQAVLPISIYPYFHTYI